MHLGCLNELIVSFILKYIPLDTDSIHSYYDKYMSQL